MRHKCHATRIDLKYHNMISERSHPEWLDLKELVRYACVSERTLRQWIHRPSDPLPAVRVASKILVRRGAFDEWLNQHRVTPVDLACIVDEMFEELTKP